MYNKDYPGNESFTISLTDFWYFFNEILIVRQTLNTYSNSKDILGQN